MEITSPSSPDLHNWKRLIQCRHIYTHLTNRVQLEHELRLIGGQTWLCVNKEKMPQGTKILPHHTMSAFRQNIFPLKLRYALFRHECVINYALLFFSTLVLPVYHLEGSLLFDRTCIISVRNLNWTRGLCKEWVSPAYLIDGTPSRWNISLFFLRLVND